MKQISEEFAARLGAAVTSLCACWRFTREDGAVFGATDHDATLAFDGVNFEPAAGLASVSFESSAGLAPGRAAGDGAFSIGFMTEADLDAGLWDGARVDVWRVDWQAMEHRIMIWSGRLSEIMRRGGGFSVELVSVKAGFERRVGRVYGRGCDADVGDARCGVDLSRSGFAGAGVVASTAGERHAVVTGLSEFESGWFSGGVIVWTGGANAGTSGRVLRHNGSSIELVRAPRFELAEGDSFTVTAGCDKAFATCGAKFANRINFRGFPHMPGPEAVLNGPAANGVNDGGRRS